MRKSTSLRMAAALAVAAVITLAATDAAMAATVGSDSSNASAGSIRYVGSGQGDVSQLTIVGMIDPSTGKVKPVTPYHPNPIASSFASPQISHPSCGSHTDYYRIINSSGQFSCFTGSGTYNGTFLNITTLCPGNNVGRVLYDTGGASTAWSVWRDTRSNWNTCYGFTTPVTVYAVQIS